MSSRYNLVNNSSTNQSQVSACIQALNEFAQNNRCVNARNNAPAYAQLLKMLKGEVLLLNKLATMLVKEHLMDVPPVQVSYTYDGQKNEVYAYNAGNCKKGAPFACGDGPNPVIAATINYLLHNPLNMKKSVDSLVQQIQINLYNAQVTRYQPQNFGVSNNPQLCIQNPKQQENFYVPTERGGMVRSMP